MRWGRWDEIGSEVLNDAEKDNESFMRWADFELTEGYCSSSLGILWNENDVLRDEANEIYYFFNFLKV